MSEVHGIVYAYRSSARLGDLTRWRTNASLPFCGRYRLIDFALSSLSNAGVHSVGVIMQRDYQSLLDHLGSGKAWDLSRRSGGLHLLPPFGANTRGDYAGTAEALNAVISYVRAIPEPEIVLMPADVVCNLDLAAAIAQHEAGGCGITAICRDGDVTGEHHRFLTDAHGRVTKLITSAAPDAGLTSMEAYIVNKDVLLAMLDLCAQENRAFFHRDALFSYLARGGTMDVFLHRGYAVRVDTVADYFLPVWICWNRCRARRSSRLSGRCARRSARMSAPITASTHMWKTASLPTAASSRARSRTASCFPACASRAARS